MLRKIFVRKGNNVTREWRKLHDEGLNDLYSSPNVIRMIKSRWMTSAGRVAHVGKREMHTWFWWRNPKGRYHFEDISVCGRIILKWILMKYAGRAWAGVI
jgi:hypothetical protein